MKIPRMDADDVEGITEEEEEVVVGLQQGLSEAHAAGSDGVGVDAAGGGTGDEADDGDDSSGWEIDQFQVVACPGGVAAQWRDGELCRWP